MKYCISLLFVLFAFAFTSNAQLTVEGDLISSTITPDTDRYALLQIRNAFKEHGVDFRYDRIDWVDGELVRIRVMLNTEDNHSAEFETQDFVQGQQIKLLYNKEENAEQVLCAGDC